MGAWSLRVRGPGGQVTLTGVNPDISLQEFQLLLQEKTGVSAARQELLSGFPPKPLQVPHHSLLAKPKYRQVTHSPHPCAPAASNQQ